MTNINGEDSMQTNIPSNVLPTDIADPNSLTTTYTTNVLYPKLGPLAVNRYVRIVAGLLRDYAAATSLVGKVRDYKKQFEIPVMVISQPDAWLKKEIIFKPLLKSADPYINTFIADLSSFRNPRVANRGLTKQSKTNLSVDFIAPSTTSTSPTLGGLSPRIELSVPLIRNPIIVTNGNVADSQISAVSDIKAGELALINGRLSADFITSHELINNSSSISETINEAGVARVDAGAVQKTAEQQKRAYLLGSIMHGLSQVNGVIPDMINQKILNIKGSLLDRSLDNDKYIDLISEALEKTVEVDEVRLKEVGKLVDQAISYLETLGLKDDKFISSYHKNSKFKNRVKRYIIGKMDKAKPIDAGLVPLPDDTDIINSREWAFQRVERLDLNLGQPVFRGPFNAESISPNSELTIAESFTSEQFDLSETLVGKTEQRSTERGTFTSSRFQSALSNMTESGVSNENSFSQDSTLLNTLREQRREVIDRTLTNISNENEQRSVTASRITTSTSRSYTTRGKDSVFATTELAFQVSAPVHAQVMLEDVNMVWAPSIPSPFLQLHRIIRNQERSSEREYIVQNYVIDPVSPFKDYERETINKELSISGDDRYQSRFFDIPIDARYSTGGWELDISATTLDFRNGTSDDYDWTEFFSSNGDDLENWSTHFKSIYQEGNRIKGEAVLETTDPEWANAGFFTFGFILRRLSERSRAELRAYEAEKETAVAEQGAVNSRAKQYAKLRKDELITYYENSLDLREEAFNALIYQVFQGTPSRHYSYYKEIIRSSINWNTATMIFEANPATGLPYPEFGRAHFMNSSGIRFILPILRGAEDAFFEAIGKNGNDYYKSSAEKVRGFTDAYRSRVEELKEIDPKALILDDYTREIVIGRHLEAVLSKHPFAND